MSAQKYHSVSSSESEKSDIDDVTEVVEEKPRGVLSLSETRDEILSKIKGVKYDKSNFKQILCSNDITEDDEIWLIQAPKAVNLKSLNTFNFNFDEDASQVTLRSHKKNKTYNIHSFRCDNEKINTALPNRKTQSFHLNVYPIVGRIILQEEIETIGKDKSSNNFLEDSSFFNDDTSKCFNVSSNTTLGIEDVNNSTDDLLPKKKKRKSTT